MGGSAFPTCGSDSQWDAPDVYDCSRETENAGRAVAVFCLGTISQTRRPSLVLRKAEFASDQCRISATNGSMKGLTRSSLFAGDGQDREDRRIAKIQPHPPKINFFLVVAVISSLLTVGDDDEKGVSYSMMMMCAECVYLFLPL